jgi:MFS family permease
MQMAVFCPVPVAGPIVSNNVPYPTLRQNIWPMVLLFCTASLYSIDKAIVGVLAEPIRTDLLLSDVQMGLLLGLAYALLSGVCGLWLGTLVDRRTRCKLLGLAVILWSLSTAAGGLAPNFASFFIFRAIVGLGEAAVAPAAVSLLADMFPPQQRGRAISIYLFGATVGTALSSIIPGIILDADLHLDLPVYGLVAPWRTSFILCGLVGPVVGLLFFTVKEPVRHGVLSGAASAMKAIDKLRYLWRERKIFVPLLLGVCLFYIAFVGVTSWTATFVIREFGIGLPEFSALMGLVLLVSGGSGYLAGGLITDSPIGRHTSGKLLLMASLPLIALPSAFALAAPSPTVALILLGTISVAAPILNVALNATVQDLLPNEMRGFVYAFISVVAALPAGAGGPLAVAFVTDHVLRDKSAIGLSILLVCLPVLLVATLTFLMSRWAILKSSTELDAHNVSLEDQQAEKQ